MALFPDIPFGCQNVQFLQCFCAPCHFGVLILGELGKLGRGFGGLASKEATLDSGCKDEPFHPCNSERVGSKMAPHMGNIVFIYSYYLLLHRDFWDSDPENSGNHKLHSSCTFMHLQESCNFWVHFSVSQNRGTVHQTTGFPTSSHPSPSCWGMTMTPRPICWPCSLPTRRPTETVEAFATWIPCDGSGSKYKG